MYNGNEMFIELSEAAKNENYIRPFPHSPQ